MMLIGKKAYTEDDHVIIPIIVLPSVSQLEDLLDDNI
jgi:hypothetical protein